MILLGTLVLQFAKLTHKFTINKQVYACNVIRIARHVVAQLQLVLHAVMDWF